MALLLGGASCTTIDGSGGVSAEADYRPRDQSAPQRYQSQSSQTYQQPTQTYQSQSSQTYQQPTQTYQSQSSQAYQQPTQTYQQDRYAQPQQQYYQQQQSWNQDYAGQQASRPAQTYQQQQPYTQDRYAQQQQWNDNRQYQNQTPYVDYTPGSDYGAAPRQGQRRSGGYGGSYTVRHGDNLYRIALNHGTTVSQLKSANGLYSDLIHPGQVLTLP
ncbi:MAG: LysM peptidoglycan-binding domain-containing protein [Roseimicrobium sp.]